MKNDEIKAANRKARPKFVLWIVICAVIGGVIGFLSAKYGLSGLTGEIKSVGAYFGTYIAPWLLLVLAVVSPIVCAVLYRGAKQLIASWDGEDEELAGRFDKKLSAALWIMSTALVLSYFLIAAAYSGGLAAVESGNGRWLFTLSVAALIAIMVEALVIQQKCVDAVKTTNPEKTASVYDMRFQKKWVDSCDEAEKLIIGKCAFKAYSATNTACAALAIVLALCALIFEIGFLPSLAVCIVWLVSLSAYYKEAMRYSKAGIKIS